MFLSILRPRIVGTPPTAYPNGYGNKLTAIAPVSAHGLAATTASLVVFITKTDANLKSVAYGGSVVSDLGWDIRCETVADGKLAHEIDTYVPSTGALSMWVRFPSVSATASIQLAIYFGKTGLLTSEEDPTTCWDGYLLSVDLATGSDHTLNSFNLTMSGVTSTMLATMKSGDFGEVAIGASNSFVTSSGDEWVTLSGDTWSVG